MWWLVGWWETQLQGAPGWLALRGDVIAGCTRLIDWPCCSVARDDGHEARSCTAATASCSLLSLLFLTLSKAYFSLSHLVSLPCFLYLLSLFFSSFVYFWFLSQPFCYLFCLLSLCGLLLQACCCLLGLLHYFLSENAAECLLKKGETLNLWALSR